MVDIVIRFIIVLFFLFYLNNGYICVCFWWMGITHTHTFKKKKNSQSYPRTFNKASQSMQNFQSLGHS